MSDEKTTPVNIKPGVPISQADREKLAKENEEASKEAQRQAQEQIQRDIANGVTPGAAGALTSVADMVKKKLERDEFSVAVDEEGRHVPARPPAKE